MCGIVGAIAQRNVTQILIEGLKRLEYRGYDSAGIAVLDQNNAHIQRLRVAGKVSGLMELLQKQPVQGYLGIAHTRWATHGQPSTLNAHPHCSSDQIVVVHNGIIENYEALKKELLATGYQFQSDTDTEVVAHLVHYHLQQESGDMLKSLQKTQKMLQGAYALSIINKDTPDKFYAVRHGCPLVLGVGVGENFIASDMLALLPVTQRFIFLEEDDIAEVGSHQYTLYDANHQPVERALFESDETAHSSSKGHYRHFMQKEIFEQPRALQDTLQGYIIDDHLVPSMFGHRAKAILSAVKRIHIVACGTSYHAGLVARYWLEQMAGIACQVEVASEYRYRDAVVEPGTLLLTLSQSGETADTLAALRKAKSLPYLATAAICNVAHSSLVRETDLVFLTRAGAEIGVAATKTFTAQLTALLLLTLLLAQEQSEKKAESTITRTQNIKALKQLPFLIEHMLALDQPIKQISKEFAQKRHALFLGRGLLFPIALEGALKLKEISYIHAEAYPAGELKHGPLALIDEEMPVIVVAPNNPHIEKLESNIEEVKTRGGQLYLFADEALSFVENSQVQVIHIPSIPEILTPIAYTIPLQLLAYHIAVLKGTDVDQPRNLAKSVTVE